MPPRRNPLQLNPLQLKTLTLLQELARLPDYSGPAEQPGDVAIANLPFLHGDHFHLGDAVVAARDATGLHNKGVWAALERKGLLRKLEGGGAALTPLGRGYVTGLREAILRKQVDSGGSVTR
jgi:ribosomal protein S19E (S16A)